MSISQENPSSSSDPISGRLEDTRTSRLIFALLLSIPIVSAILYGGVDFPALGLLALAAAMIAVLWLSTIWGTGRFQYSTNILQIPILALIALATIQLLPIGGPALPEGLSSLTPAESISLDPFATRFFIVRLAAIFIFFAAALTFISSESRIRKTVITIVIFGSLMAFFGILQRLAQPEAIYGLRPTPQAIPFGPFINQHHFAAFMEMTCGLTLGLIFGNGVKGDKKPLLWIAAVVMALAVVFTGSRGGFLSFIAMFLFVSLASFVFRDRGSSVNGEIEGSSRGRKLAAIAGGAAILMVLIGLIGFLGAGEGLLRGMGGDPNVDPTSGRGHFWTIAIKIFLANPILGAGFDAFGAAFTKYDTWSGMFRVEQAHNDYLQMLADGGILGFLCVAAFIFYLFKNGIRSISGMHDKFERAAAIGALAGCFGILIHSFFDFPLRTTSNSYFFLLLVVIATSAGTHRRRRREHRS